MLTTPVRHLFGTDGIRSRAGQSPLDGETMNALGFHLARVLRRDRGCPRPRVLIVWDGRESGPALLEAIGSGIARAGGDVALGGLLPTPAVSVLVRELGFDAGISLSASHNPWHDNGVKIFSATGEKLPDAEEADIEAAIFADPGSEGGQPTALPATDAAFSERYRRHLADGTGRPRLAGRKLVVDAANGAASEIAPALLRELGAEVVADAVTPTGRNINDGVGALHPERLAARVLAEGADLGIALDGDADRLVVVDESGSTWDGDDLLFAFACDRLDRDRLGPKVVVATVMSNFALESALQDRGVALIRAAVGDRYVWQAMLEHDARLGGEQSGHLIFRPEATTGDGLFAALELLALLERRSCRLSALRQLQKMPQRLVNVRVARRVPLADVPAVAAEIATVERLLAGRGRLLIRYSGTEPLLRIMLEGSDLDEIETLAKRLADRIGRELGAH